MFQYAKAGAFDAIIFPSATYRYLRALAISPLKNSPVPVLFLIHGVTPKEAVRLQAETKKFLARPNIRVGVQTFAKEKLELDGPNISIYSPPNYIPRDIDPAAQQAQDGILRLGFFGQYRREKKLDAFLEVYKTCAFNRPVRLIVQGATQTPVDAEDFDRIIKKYEGADGLEFWHRALIGVDWQKGLASVDAIVMPYGNDRYLYHTSAILSNAIGYRKAVINADNVNPEVLQRFKIGMDFKNGDSSSLKTAIETFVNTYDAQAELYREQLQAAYEEYSPAKLAANIAALAKD
jgi:glycosyltransferase involved in cell wall biosynthesis